MTHNFKWGRILFQSLLIYFVCSGIWTTCLAQGTIYVSGTYTGKTTWSADTVKVTGWVSADTLIIEPGTVVEFQTEYGLHAEKYLYANGAIGDTILFTKRDTTGFSNPNLSTGGWGGIGGRNVKLNYCKIQYVKKFNRNGSAVNADELLDIQNSSIINNFTIGIYSEFNTIKVNKSIISNNSGGGIFAHRYGKLFVENSTIELNGNYGIKTSESSLFYIISNIIQNNRGSGIERHSYEYPNNGVVMNNIIRFNNGNGITMSMGAEIPILNNLIVGNSKAGISLGSTSCPLVNNTIIKNSNGIIVYNSDLNIYNTICRDNDTKELEQNIKIDFGSFKIYNSNIEGFPNNNFDGEFVKNIDTDPKFVDTTNFDFHLSDSSPCVNTGTPDTTGLFLPSTDIDGNPRITNGWIDMGAFESLEFPGNQPPLIEKIKDREILTSQTDFLTVKYYDPDSGEFSTVLDVFSDTPEIKVRNLVDSLNCASFVIAPDSDWQGIGTIQIQVTDNHGNVSSQEFQVIVSKNKTVCGRIKENTLWDADTIKVACDVVVSSNVTLTIKPGTVVAFANNCGLIVTGSIVAVGNKDSVITFTSYDTTGFYNQTYSGWKGIGLYGENTEFRYCDFLYAKSEEYGGALYFNSINLRITNCRFYNNYSQRSGGAIYAVGNVPEFKNNVFVNNGAKGIGGAIYLDDPNIDIVNSLFYKNQAHSGAAIFASYGTTRLINNTIVGNKAETGGGGIIMHYANIMNCIIWDNDSEITNSQVTIDSCTAGNCIIEGGVTGINYTKSAPVITGTVYSYDPAFVNKTLFDFHLTDTSAGINSGTVDTTGLSLPIDDLAGNPRIFQGNNKIVDIGAYEFQREPYNRQPEIFFPKKLYFKTSTPDREIVKFIDPDDDDTHILHIISADENLQIVNVSGDTSGSYFDLVPKENWEGRTSISIQIEDSYGNVSEHRCNVIVGYIACGEMPNNIVWDADTIHVTCDITIPENTSLTIKPGTVVLFHGFWKIRVLGNIKAIGKVSDQIIFTSDDSAIYYAHIKDENLSGKIGWDGITFSNEMIDNQISMFHHCNFKFASGTVLYCSDYPGIEIRNCVFKYNISSPIYSGNNSLIKNCIFAFNKGAIKIGGTAIVDSCNFSNNLSVGESGAIKLMNGNQIVSNCLFDNNYCRSGACLSCDGISNSNIRISKNIFINNHSDYAGTGAAILNSGVLFDNNLIYFNHGTKSKSKGASGGVCVYGKPVLLNNTIAYNTVTGGMGGGMFIDKDSDPIIYNTILYGNTSDGIDNQIHCDYRDYDLKIPDVRILYSDLQGGKDGITGKVNLLQYENNLDTNPLFVDTLNLDFHLSEISPCINAGTVDTTGLDLPGTDLEGNPRVFDGRIDMGVFEYQQDNFHILKQPVSQVICEGALATLETEAIGGVIGYQWQKNGADIPSANQNTLTLGPLNPKDSGYYNCLIIADDKIVSTDTIILSIPNPDPPVSHDTTICEGQPVPDLNASGDHIMWYSDAELINPVYSGSNFKTGHSNPGLYGYYVTQTVSGCESTAGLVKLTINRLPEISLGKDSTILTNQSFILGPYTNSYSYLWNDNSENPYLEISGKDLGPGRHAISVMVTDMNTCQNSDTMIVHVVPLTNLNQTQNNNLLYLFPNPTDGLLNIEVSDFNDGEILVKLINQLGEEIFSDKNCVEKKGGTIQLNLTSVPAGIYYVQIITNNTQYMGKVVLQ